MRKLRLQQGLSIRDVVSASEDMLDKTTLSRIERDERGLSLKAAYCLSRIYNVDMETLAQIVLKKKVSHQRAPFDTSAAERKFLKKHRALSRKHQRIVMEITNGLVLIGDLDSHEEGRRKLIEDLKGKKH